MLTRAETGKAAVAEVAADRNGLFEVRLRAGDYWIREEGVPAFFDTYVSVCLPGNRALR